MYKVVVYDNRAFYPTNDGININEYTFIHLPRAIRMFVDVTLEYKGMETEDLMCDGLGENQKTSIDVYLRDDTKIIDKRTFYIFS